MASGIRVLGTMSSVRPSPPRLVPRQNRFKRGRPFCTTRRITRWFRRCQPSSPTPRTRPQSAKRSTYFLLYRTLGMTSATTWVFRRRARTGRTRVGGETAASMARSIRSGSSPEDISVAWQALRKGLLVPSQSLPLLSPTSAVPGLPSLPSTLFFKRRPHRHQNKSIQRSGSTLRLITLPPYSSSEHSLHLRIRIHRAIFISSFSRQAI